MAKNGMHEDEEMEPYRVTTREAKEQGSLAKEQNPAWIF
jgi:hypothetical protein